MKFDFLHKNCLKTILRFYSLLLILKNNFTSTIIHFAWFSNSFGAVNPKMHSSIYFWSRRQWTVFTEFVCYLPYMAWVELRTFSYVYRHLIQTVYTGYFTCTNTPSHLLNGHFTRKHSTQQRLFFRMGKYMSKWQQ